MRFRPCIDLHQGLVKQIVGASLDDVSEPETNFATAKSPAEFASLFRDDELHSGHVIMLGSGNEEAAKAALEAYPQGLQLGGGINPDNAKEWLDRGAAAVIVTSYLFSDGQLDLASLERMVESVGRSRLVLDLSCARTEGGYVVAADRWQTLTDFVLSSSGLESLASSCCEFLVHATDQEGRQQGIDSELVRMLADSSPIPTTYAGGIRCFEDIDLIGKLGNDRLDFTVGSALDLFGGTGVRYKDLVEYNHRGTTG